MLNIIICGAPGSGKGTQSDLIVKKYNLKHLSTGDLLRKEIADKTELGQIAESYISKGSLVPDKMIIDILMQAALSSSNEANGIILDGFPRTLPQAEALETIFAENGLRVDVLVDLSVDDELLIERLLLRGQTSGRTDDNLETIKKRLDVYYSQTTPVSEYYRNLNKYAAINGVGAIDEIFARIESVLDEKLK